MSSSGPEIVKHIIDGRVQPNLMSHGLKHRHKMNSDEENKCIAEYQNNLRRSLSAKHISRISERSTAEISTNCRISIGRRCGKWQTFNKDGFLNPSEALYLLQNNQLAIYENDVIVSVEKAFCIFLSNQRGFPYANEGEFQILSHLNRNAYKVAECNLKSDSDRSTTNRLTEIYIWNNLFELIGLVKPASVVDAVGLEVKKSMNRTIESIKNQNYDRVAPPPATVPDRLSCLPNGTQNIRITRRLNHFMLPNELYRAVFDQIDIIAPMTYRNDASNAGEDSMFRVLHAYLDDMKDTLSYRIVFLRENQTPSIKRAYEMYKQKPRRTNVIFVFVAPDYSFYSFVYRFYQ